MPAPKPPQDPRVVDALDQLQKAQRLVSDSAETLCSVPGYAEEWEGLTELYHRVQENWQLIHQRQAELASMRLILGESQGRPEYFLAGRPVDPGAQIEVDLPDEDDGWQPVRFEWTQLLDDVPRLVLESGRNIPLPELALFRWPVESSL